MTDRTERQPEERRTDPDRTTDPSRRMEDPAEPEWVLQRIQQSFETRRG